jgi:hypothetical protein
MSELKNRLERGVAGFSPSEDVSDAIRRARRRHRRRMMSSAAVAMLAAAGGISVALLWVANPAVPPPVGASPSGPVPITEGPVRVVQARADVGFSLFDARDPGEREIVIDQSLDDPSNEHFSTGLFEFQLRRPVVPLCLNQVVLELYSEAGSGEGGLAVYPADVTAVGPFERGDRRSHTVLDTDPQGIPLEVPVRGWLRFDVTDVYRLWLDETSTAHGFGPISSNVVLVVRSQDFTVAFSRRLVSTEGAADLRPRLLVEEAFCREQPRRPMGPVIVASGSIFGRDWRAYVERTDGGWDVGNRGGGSAGTGDAFFTAQPAAILMYTTVSRGYDDVFVGAVAPRDTVIVVAELGDGRTIQGLVVDPPDDMGAPFRMFVLFIPNSAPGVVRAFDSEGHELARAHLSDP